MSGFTRPSDSVNTRSLYPAEPRVIKGNDKGFLPVPGLTKLVAIFMGREPMELETVMKVPIDKDHNAHSTSKVPLVLFEANDPNVGPYLMRSELSNNGIWQSAQEFTVCGEWEPESETPARTVADEAVPATKETPDPKDQALQGQPGQGQGQAG